MFTTEVDVTSILESPPVESYSRCGVGRRPSSNRHDVVEKSGPGVQEEVDTLDGLSENCLVKGITFIYTDHKLIIRT